MKKVLTLIFIERKLKANQDLSKEDVKFLLDNLNANNQVKIDYAFYLCKQNKKEESLSLIKEILPSLKNEKLFSVCMFLLYNGDEQTFLSSLDMAIKEGHPKALEIDKFLKEHYSKEEIENNEVDWRNELIKFSKDYPTSLIN